MRAIPMIIALLFSLFLFNGCGEEYSINPENYSECHSWTIEGAIRDGEIKKAILVVAGTMFVGGMAIWMGPGVRRLDEGDDPSLFITGLSMQLASLLLEVGCIKKLTARHHISGKYATDLVNEYNAALEKRLGVRINMNF